MDGGAALGQHRLLTVWIGVLAEHGFLGPGVRPRHVAAKQGWIGYRPYRLLHSTAVLGSRRQYVAVLLTQQSNGYSYPDVAAHVTQAAGLLLTTLGSAARR